MWVRHKVTGYVGYISHVERVRGEPPQVWVVYPPGKQADGNRIKTYSASSTSADNLVRLKRRRKKLG